MFWQSLTDIQKYAVIGVLAMAIVVFGLPLLLMFLDRRGFNTHLAKPKDLNREERRKEKRLAKKRRHRR
ncbi:MAG TPA: hypothetical protein PKY59_01685 [Pyrinomonadaceae bacterium]|nr:hypothetical protein [Pyrinomonadaceae bacterium]